MVARATKKSPDASSQSPVAESAAVLDRGTSRQGERASSGGSAHIVIFKSGEGFFGIDIGIVQEIVLMQEITLIPGSASYIAGMTDLRGRVIPVAAFTSLLGITPTQANDDTRILVVENGAGHTGFIVDAVSEVMMVDNSRIEDASGLGSREHDFIVGIAKLEDHLVSLVDVTRLLAAADRHSALSEAA
jgi:purine-binding chemotaxis protein CheW